MASLIYDSALYDALTGAIDFGADDFKALLVGPGYLPDKATHARRADVTDEIKGKGYQAGGGSVAVAARQADGDTAISLGGALWTAATLSASGAVYFKTRGGPAADDELVAYIDFRGPVKATNGDFRLDASTIRLAPAPLQ